MSKLTVKKAEAMRIANNIWLVAYFGMNLTEVEKVNDIVGKQYYNDDSSVTYDRLKFTQLAIATLGDKSTKGDGGVKYYVYEISRSLPIGLGIKNQLAEAINTLITV